jgi:hypothetical protein
MDFVPRLGQSTTARYVVRRWHFLDISRRGCEQCKRGATLPCTSLESLEALPGDSFNVCDDSGEPWLYDIKGSQITPSFAPI